MIFENLKEKDIYLLNDKGRSSDVTGKQKNVFSMVDSVNKRKVFLGEHANVTNFKVFKARKR